MIVRAHGGNRVITRASNGGELVPPPGGGLSYAAGQVKVTDYTAGGIPAFDAAIRVASEAVASIELCVKECAPNGLQRRIEDTWQAKFFDARPNPKQSWFTFWELVEASLTARRNAYIWRTLDRGRCVAMWALHPDQVVVRVSSGRVEYSVFVGMGFTDPLEATHPGFATVDAEVMNHLKGPGGGGVPMAPTAIEMFRSTIGAALGQQQWQEGFYRRGTGGGLVLSFPADIQPIQAERAKRMWDESNAGVMNAHGTRVISGGATVTPVTITQSDAQFIETHALTVQDIARITGVTASLIGGAATTTQASAPISPEHEMTRWVTYGLRPRLERLEDALESDATLFPPGSRGEPEFDRDLILADRATEATITKEKVQSGQWLVDEARARDGLPPLPNGWGQIPQIVPVGGGAHGVPDPTATPPEPPPAE